MLGGYQDDSKYSELVKSWKASEKKYDAKGRKLVIEESKTEFVLNLLTTDGRLVGPMLQNYIDLVFKAEKAEDTEVMTLIRKVENAPSDFTAVQLLTKAAKDHNLAANDHVDPGIIGFSLSSERKDDMLKIRDAYKKYVFDNVNVAD